MATIPTVEELRDELDLHNGVSDATIADVLEAELDDQNSLCGVEDEDGVRVARDPYPARLRRALIRRVNRVLAVNDEPLGIVTGAGDGATGLTRITGRDRETERLERRYLNYKGMIR